MSSQSDPIRVSGNASGRATRELLIVTAERMFADRGIHGVSLREIGLAAGQRNNNVIPYHFGNRQGLIRAIYAFRSEQINHRRMELLADEKRAGRTADVIDCLLRILVQPHAEAIDDPDNHFVGLLARLLLDFGSIANAEAEGARPNMSAHTLLRSRIRACVPHLSPAEFQRRFDLLFDMAITAFAVRKRVGPGGDAFGSATVLDDVVAIMSASLRDPQLDAGVNRFGAPRPGS